jgi:hypothetical protein
VGVDEAMRLADQLLGDRYLETKGVGIELVARYHRQFTPSLLPRWKRGRERTEAEAMGAEAKCRARVGNKTVEGTARLETDALRFRGGEVRIAIRFESIAKLAVADRSLVVTTNEGTTWFELGPAAAARWMDKIRNPPSRLQKLGAKADWRVAAIGIDDEVFLGELRAAAAQLSIGRVSGRCDAIFFGATAEGQLTRLNRLRRALKPNGALWVVRPKGRPEISERAVMAAGKAAGLVDVKVVSFSPTHTAEKFVIPLSNR